MEAERPAARAVREDLRRRCRGVKRTVWLVFGLVLSGCSGGGSSGGPGSGPREVEISWAANRETGVNAPGGGYRVYHASVPDFDIATATPIDVAYAGGPSSPTRVVVTLPVGTTYIKITAYSALNPAGSVPSPETAVTLD